MHLFKIIMRSLLCVSGCALCWQGMNELYKFDEANGYQVCFMLACSFIQFAIAISGLQGDIESKEK
jgi:hypothetical protein